MSAAPTILHVTEAFGAGVATALCGMVEASPRWSHHLAYSPRADVDDDGLITAQFASTTELPTSPIFYMHQLRKLIKRVEPDVLHCHSSWAGLYTRLLYSPLPIVYSPHCFAFNRTDVDRARRKIFWLVERLLAPRTTSLLANGAYERQWGERLGHQHVASVPMFSPGLVESMRAIPDREPIGPEPVVAAVGRWCPQKGPDFFAQVCRLTNAKPGETVEFVWLGGPDFGLLPPAHLPYRMSGWLERPQLLDELRKVDVVIHTAAWEAGVPLAILEALSAGKLILLRTLDSARELETISFDEPEAMASFIRELTESHQLQESVWDVGQSYLQTAVDQNRSFDVDSYYKSVMVTKKCGLKGGHPHAGA